MKPLEGIRVAALEHFIAGPYCTMLLQDWGAEVVKIERPGGGDPRRAMSTVEGETRTINWTFEEYNRGKKSLVVDLKKEAGRETVRDLVKISDIFVVNYHPEVTEKLGLDYKSLKEINPKLIYVEITGFGKMEGFTGPFSHQPAFDILAEALSGFISIVYGEDAPASVLYALPDLLGGQWAATGALTGLLQRERNGEGGYVDIALLDTMIALMERPLSIYAFENQLIEPKKDRLVGPRGAFKCKDGYVVLTLPGDYLWERMANLIGRPDLIGIPETLTGKIRAKNNDTVLRPAIEAWMSGQTCEEIITQMVAVGLACAPLRTIDQAYHCEHVRARKMLIPAEKTPHSPCLVRGPVLAEFLPPPEAGVPGPKLGEHTRYVLEDVIQYSPEKIARLFDSKAVEGCK